MEEVQGFDPEVVVLPLGSTEPHGPHLPYGTDTMQVTRSARLAVEAANAQGARVLLYPTLPITNNVNFRKLPFGLRIGVRTLMTVLVDVVTQCQEDGIRKVVIMNGHGGNSETVPAALREIAGMDDMPFVCTASPKPPPEFKNPIVHPSSHAGESETSRMLWIRPDLVREDRLADFPVSEPAFEGLNHAHFVRPWHLYLPESAGGEAREASADKGKSVIETNAKAMAEFLVALSNAEMDDWFPYKRP